MENLDRSWEIPERERRRRKDKSIVSPNGGGEPHEVEIEYWEIRPDVWEKVGAEKIIGPAPKKEKEKGLV